MNAKGILEQLTKQAGSHRGGAPGKGIDTRKLVGGSALGMLLGSKRGRKLGGKGLKYGALAGVGVLAWKAWERYQADAPQRGEAHGASTGEPLERVQGEKAQERRSLAILKAMIAAARSDGHIDDAERAQLTEYIDALGADADLHAWVERQMQAPLNANEVASEADSPQAAREMYLASVAIIDDQNPMERAWLDQLAASLGLEWGVVQELERQATEDA